MRPSVFIAIVTAGLFCEVWGSAEETIVHQYPHDKEALVFVLDHEGGLTPPRLTNTPFLRIYGDGRVIVTHAFAPEVISVEGHLTRAELDELVRWAVIDQRFFWFDEAAVRKAIDEADKASGRSMVIADAEATVITLTAELNTVTHRWYALGAYTVYYPQIKMLTRLWEIEQRLHRIADQVKRQRGMR